MDFRYIKLIATIVETGSITKASEVLHLTQSALSHQLKEVEGMYGIRFFTRANRKLILTEAGRLVYEVSGKILTELNCLDSRLKSLGDETSGTIRLNAACTTSYHWLPGIMHTFQEEYPNITVEVIIDPTFNPVQEIIKGNIDLSVMVSPEENDKIDYEFLFKDELVALFSNQHPFNNKSYLIAKDFQNEHLIIHSKPLNTVVFYEHVLKPKGIEPYKISELPLTEATIELIKANMGVAVMSKWSVQPYIDSGIISYRRVNRNGLFRNHYAATLKSSMRPSYLDRFIGYLKETRLPV